MDFKRKVPAARDKEKGFIKLTSKQLAVYYWFISESYYNSQAQENHYYIYKEDVNCGKIAKELGIGSVNTVKSAIKKLQDCNYIIYNEGDAYYKIPHKEYYTYINVKLIKFLLAWSGILGAEILLYYSILKRFYELNEERGTKTKFNTKTMVKILGHNGKDDSIYKCFKLYLVFLESFKLISTKSEIKQIRGGRYIEYTLLDIKETTTEECEYKETGEMIEVSEELIEKLTKSIDFNAE